MNKIEWPENPKHGDKFCYICPIGGTDYIEWVYLNNEWHYLENEGTKTLLKLLDLPKNWRYSYRNIFE